MYLPQRDDEVTGIANYVDQQLDVDEEEPPRRDD